VTVVRCVPSKGCSDELYRAALTQPDALVVDVHGSGANVAVRILCDGTNVQVAFSDLARDLVDLAATVYVADEQIPRGDGADGWGRLFEFVVPVRDVSRWQTSEEKLARALSFVSGDDYTFSWAPLARRLGPHSRHRKRLRGQFDRVCLFSGGIDSLLGAAKYLDAGERLLLVGHQAESASSGAQNRLVPLLRKRYPGQFCFVQCRIARSRATTPTYPMPKPGEDTHRTRSFLFLSLATAIAEKCGVDKVSMPENGLIALNVPLQASRVGALSTRTAHPLFLSRYLDFASSAGVFAGSLHNPFMFMSKTDMIEQADPWLAPLLRQSVSCSRPSRWKSRGVWHCGYCVPCLYRRFALLSKDLDDANEYAFDVFKDITRVSQRLQIDGKALVAFVRRVERSTEAELYALIYRHGWFADSALRELGDQEELGSAGLCAMIRRWAVDTSAKLSEHCSAKTKKVLGISSRRGT
jgi:7-cyano-7-deazaguanine synthase in queuosine biosynthesis